MVEVYFEMVDLVIIFLIVIVFLIIIIIVVNYFNYYIGGYNYFKSVCKKFKFRGVYGIFD